MAEPALLLVYHADSGHWQALWDMAHKIVSPNSYPCALCALTHSVLGERDAWKRFKEHHPGSLEILHRDEFRRQYPDLEISTPCVLTQVDGHWAMVIDRDEVQACRGVDALIAHLERILERST